MTNKFLKHIEGLESDLKPSKVVKNNNYEETLNKLLNHIKDIKKDLKPCPFCGSKATAEEFEDGSGYNKSWDFRVTCSDPDCNAQFHVGLCEAMFYPNEPYEKIIDKNIKIVNKIVKKWNTRV
jgi:hypothetical protein